MLAVVPAWGAYINNEIGRRVGLHATDRLYAAADALQGAALWSEEQTVTSRGGACSADLGSVTDLTLPFDRDYWLGIQLGSDSEMAPRIRISSAAAG